MRMFRFYRTSRFMRTRAIKLPVWRQIYIVEGRGIEIVIGIVIIIVRRVMVDRWIIFGVPVQVEVIIVRIFIKCGREKIWNVCFRPDRQVIFKWGEMGVQFGKIP